MGKYTNIDEITKVIDDILRVLEQTVPFNVDLLEATLKQFRSYWVYKYCVQTVGDPKVMKAYVFFFSFLCTCDGYKTGFLVFVRAVLL